MQDVRYIYNKPFQDLQLDKPDSTVAVRPTMQNVKIAGEESKVRFLFYMVFFSFKQW